MRASGQDYATQRFEMPDGAEVAVRISQDQEYITIRATGGWLAYAASANLLTSAAHLRATYVPTPLPSAPVDPEPPEFYETLPFSPTMPTPPMAWVTGGLQRIFRTEGTPPNEFFYLGIPPWGEDPTLDPVTGGAWTYMGNALPGHTPYYYPSQWLGTPTIDWMYEFGFDPPFNGTYNISDAGDPLIAAYLSYFHAGVGDVIAAQYEAYLEYVANIEASNAPAIAFGIASRGEYLELLAIWTAARDAWEDYLESGAHAALLAEENARKRAARITARPGQIQEVYDELDLGLASPWVYLSVLPPPTMPKSVHSLAFPIAVTASDGTTFEFELTDYSETPPTTRKVTGTAINSGQSSADSCGLSYNRIELDNMWVSDETLSDMSIPAAGRRYIPSAAMSFGYFVTGYIDILQEGVQLHLDYTTPPEYMKYLKTPMRTDPEPTQIKSDAYVLPGASLTMLYLEWEAYDEYTDQWLWVPTPRVLLIDPIYICGGPREPKIVTRVRSVRARKMTNQVLSKDWVWSTPTELPLEVDFAKSVTVFEDLSSYLYPPALALLDKVPGRTIPDAPLDGVVYAARLGAEVDLREATTSEWQPDPREPGWLDRLVMVAVVAAGKFKEPE